MSEAFVLPGISWLESLTPEERQLFTSFGEIISLPPKEIIIREGEAQPYLFFVLKGMLSVRRGDAVVAVVCEREFLGEMTIATKNRLASATVLALEPCEVWRMSQKTLMRFFDEHKEAGLKILLALLSTVSERLYAVNTDLAELLNERRRGDFA